MNYNAKINWQPGQEITASTLHIMESTHDMRQRVALQLAMGAGVRGIISGTELSCKPVFVGKEIEITGMKMTALLPSGNILSIDEDPVIKIDKEKIESLIEDDNDKQKVYLTVALSDEQIEYEIEDQQFLKPLLLFTFCNKEEVEQSDCMPIARLIIEEGSLSIDSEYILPAISVSSIPQLVELKQYLQQKYVELTSHNNLETSDLKAFLTQLVCQPSSLGAGLQTNCFMEGVSQTIGVILTYLEGYVNSHQLSEERKDIPVLQQVSILSIDTFISNIKEVIEAVSTALDICIVEDHSIDYDKLKEDLKAEILEIVQPEMEEKIVALRTEMHDQLIEELDQRLHTAIENMMEELRSKLHNELRDDLYSSLYNALYTALHDALYQPLPTTDNEYTPLI